MRSFLAFLFLIVAGNSSSQCILGNCVSGKGKFYFGWCTYEGEFKNSKPDGDGLMKYSNYSFKGHFSNGFEDGAGTVTYADGRTEVVRYSKGKKIEGPEKITASEYKSFEGHDPNCISGDCINGSGTYQFPSGNKYIGNFKDRKREGKGTFYFENGDKFTGTWSENQKSEGTYYFSNGARYTGTYDQKGMELNGKIANGLMDIPYINGVARIPPEPKSSVSDNIQEEKNNAESKSQGHFCFKCSGTGRIHNTIRFGETTYDSYGHQQMILGDYETCNACGGTGKVK